MDKDNEIELVQTIQEKDKRIKELEEKAKELEYMYENTKRELIARTNKYIEVLEKLKDSVPKDKIRELLKDVIRTDVGEYPIEEKLEELLEEE